MRIEHNLDGSYCNCSFDWVVIDENEQSVFGADTEEECQEYIDNYKII